MTDLKQAALWYAQSGWRVVPLHWIQDDGCSCGKSGCSSPGKHPLTGHGLKDASDDARIIGQWWTRWPAANVGIIAGRQSGIVVVDIDPRHGGDNSLDQLQKEHGQLPDTVEAATGGGGRHFIFAHPGREVRNKVNLVPGIDIRGDGGYIVAPPSNHVSGEQYRWRSGFGLHERQPARLPDWLRELLNASSEPASAPSDESGVLLTAATQYVGKAKPANEGARNNAALNLAGHLYAFQTPSGHRLDDSQVYDLARLWNQYNSPPLPESELRTVVASAKVNGTPRAPHVVGEPTSPRSPSTAPATARTPAPRIISAFTPFPVAIMPEPIQSYISQGEAALRCDPCFIALPILAGLASAIGNSRRIALKRSWLEPPILWTAVVCESGSMKSPALDLALRPIEERQHRAMERYDNELDLYNAEMEQYRARKNAPQSSSCEPVEPIPERCLISEITIEAVALRLQQNPRGLLMKRDELAGWWRAFDKYSQGRGGEAQQWLEMHGGRSILIDRKSAGNRPIHVRNAALCVTGGIQPDILRKTLTAEHRESGMAARLFMACPPRRPKVWTDDDIDPVLNDAVDVVFDRLFALQPTFNAAGSPMPIALPLTREALDLYANFVNAHGREQLELSGDLAAAWSKLEGGTARLALIVHCLRQVADDPALASNDEVDANSMQTAIALSAWFKEEAERVYAILGESDNDRHLRLLAESIQRRGGVITPRDLSQRYQRYRPVEVARQALQVLVVAGWGHWEHPAPGTRGGHPSTIFRLDCTSPVYETVYDDPASGGFVGANSVDDAPDTAPADDEGTPDNSNGEWGEV